LKKNIIGKGKEKLKLTEMLIPFKKFNSFAAKKPHNFPRHTKKKNLKNGGLLFVRFFPRRNNKIDNKTNSQNYLMNFRLNCSERKTFAS